MSGGDLGSVLTQGATRESMKAAMTALYRELPVEQAPAYRELFQRLAAGEVPLAFNCSAGKDRAGLGAALILSMLGIPDETIFADYAMSGEILKHSNMMDTSSDNKAFSPLARLSPEVLEPLLASDRDYIETAFVSIRERYGSVENYVRKGLGISDAQITKIRSQLLE